MAFFASPFCCGFLKTAPLCFLFLARMQNGQQQQTPTQRKTINTKKSRNKPMAFKMLWKSCRSFSTDSSKVQQYPSMPGLQQNPLGDSQSKMESHPAAEMHGGTYFPIRPSGVYLLTCQAMKAHQDAEADEGPHTVRLQGKKCL